MNNHLTALLKSCIDKNRILVLHKNISRILYHALWMCPWIPLHWSITIGKKNVGEFLIICSIWNTKPGNSILTFLLERYLDEKHPYKQMTVLSLLDTMQLPQWQKQVCKLLLQGSLAWTLYYSGRMKTEPDTVERGAQHSLSHPPCYYRQTYHITQNTKKRSKL